MPLDLAPARLSETLTFTLPGTPQGKGRARAFVRAGHVAHYTPEQTRSYEGMIREAARMAMAGRLPMTDPVAITITAVFDVPASYSKKRTAAALLGTLWPAKKPDIDNIAKVVTDACNTVVFKDDAQIVWAHLVKRYGQAPMVVVVVKPLTATAAAGAS